MTLTFNPIVLSFGPVAVRWFGLLALLGLGLAIWLSLRELQRRRLGRRRALDALAWGLPAGILAARLVHVLGYWDYYLTNASELPRLPIDGLSLWGGLVGGGLIMAGRLRGDAPRRRRILDVIAPYTLVGIAIGRFGEFLDGHGQGVPSTLPWATQYADRLAATPDFGVFRHPVQLYDGVAALAVCGLALAVPRRAPPGTRFALCLVLYAAARLGLGAVRLDPAFLFGLQIDQLLALGSIAVGVVFGLTPLLWSRGAAVGLQPTTDHVPAKEDSLAA